jgi:hypothetical protein
MAEISMRTWRLPLGEGRVACPTLGSCDVERCLACPSFIGYIDGAIICNRDWPSPVRRRRRRR